MAWSGWIKLHRRLLDCPELKANRNARSVWLELMLRAAHEPTRVIWRGQSLSLERGELVVSMRELAEWAGVSYQECRTVCRLFDKADMAKFNAEANATATRVSLCNFDEYQGGADDANAEANASPTQQQRIANAQNKNNKKIKTQDSSLRSESERARKPAPATRIPDDWTLTPELIAFGREKGFDDGRIRDMAEAFVDHWRSSDKPTARKRDWVAAFRQWVRHELERPSPQPAGPGSLNGSARGHGALGQTGRTAAAAAVVHAREQRAHRDQH